MNRWLLLIFYLCPFFAVGQVAPSSLSAEEQIRMLRHNYDLLLLQKQLVETDLILVKSKLEDSQEALQSKERIVERLRDTIYQMEAQQAALQAELNRVIRQREDLRREVQQLTRDTLRLYSTVLDLKAANRDLIRQRDSVQNVAEALRYDSVQLEARIDTLEATMYSLVNLVNSKGGALYVVYKPGPTVWKKEKMLLVKPDGNDFIEKASRVKELRLEIFLLYPPGFDDSKELRISFVESEGKEVPLDKPQPISDYFAGNRNGWNVYRKNRRFLLDTKEKRLKKNRSYVYKIIVGKDTAHPVAQGTFRTR